MSLNLAEQKLEAASELSQRVDELEQHNAFLETELSECKKENKVL